MRVGKLVTEQEAREDAIDAERRAVLRKM